MEDYKIKNVSFAYPDRENYTLSQINLSIAKSEFVTILGKSGCGKTTLLRLLKPTIAPFGEMEGKIFFKDLPLNEIAKREEAEKIGFVMQSCDNQLVTDKVWHELSFGLESLGVKSSEIRARVAEIASFFGIESWFYKKVSELSGGEKQLLNLASVMVMQPSVLILDEPTSQLDPIAAQEFLKVLEKINRELGTTVIIAEHRTEEVFAISDRVVVMDNGRIVFDGAPYEVGKKLREAKHDMYRALPAPVRIYNTIENGESSPLTVREGKSWLLEYKKKHKLNPDFVPKDKNEENKETVIKIKNTYFRYEKNSPNVIKGLSLEIFKGEIFAILGGNGTGKTTALSLISGLNVPQRGEVLINGEKISKIKNLYGEVLGVLPQNPQTLFVKDNVYDDLLDMLTDEKSKEEKAKKITDIAKACHIEGLFKNHPYDLSGGEQQRVALAKVLLKNPKILLLDEPTKGMDAHFKEIFANILENLKICETTIVMVSHDVEFCAEYADRCALFFDGSIISQAKPREFFAGKSFYTTTTSRMAREILPQAILAKDVILAFGKREEKKDDKINLKPFLKEEKGKKQIQKKDITQPEKKKKFSENTIIALFWILIVVPLTIYAGIFLIEGKNYYLTSLLVMAESMLPFFMIFEKRKPEAREIVMISVLCAIAVAGRMVFFAFPHFKPVAAIVIISGVCFGSGAGFLTGAITAFVSNFFFGQGLWTPWQMYAYGIIGFVAGLIFKEGFLKKERIYISIFGILATFLIYGGIMNPASVIIAQQSLNLKTIIASYIVAAPLDLVHAFATAFFLWFIAEPMLNKMERIKRKYDILQ